MADFLSAVLHDVSLPDYCDLLKLYDSRNNRFLLRVFLLVAKTK